MFSKKGISPLIAAVMLLGLVVALGAIVMIWSKSYVSTQLGDANQKIDSEQVCGTDVNFKLVDISGVKQLCYDETNSGVDIKYVIENGPEMSLRGLSAQVLTSSAVVKNQTLPSAGINPGETVFGNFSFSGVTNTSIKKFTISGIIQYESTDGLKQVTCSNYGIERTLINSCDSIGMV